MSFKVLARKWRPGTFAEQTLFESTAMVTRAQARISYPDTDQLEGWMQAGRQYRGWVPLAAAELPMLIRHPAPEGARQPPGTLRQ